MSATSPLLGSNKAATTPPATPTPLARTLLSILGISRIVGGVGGVAPTVALGPLGIEKYILRIIMAKNVIRQGRVHPNHHLYRCRGAHAGVQVGPRHHPALGRHLLPVLPGPVQHWQRAHSQLIGGVQRYGCLILAAAGAFACIQPMLGWLISNVYSTASVGLAVTLNVGFGAGVG
ncbi:hypothetical protein B0T25DRAFT_627410 [Lasiosphaeria hispida]|uniref:Major facilitator superfamily (MFS) profile domain-containing protein n=1 Tax=Lasiosphaeria hispida TaxID=260671 RepID=A0AAJ0HV52_9PEZI|nr:hypothetical protein B0T25DRAFT_627410 [Lasiosphaeria hispida]